jgi:predicted DCC family thiol-disulfide oxidoreductase YuxK
MSEAAAQSPSSARGTHLLLYDGVCGLCNRLLQFVLRHDRRGRFSFASLQSAVGRSLVEGSGGNPSALTSFYVFTDFQSGRSRALTRSEAALFVAGQLGWPWTVAACLRLLPLRTRDRLYDAVARRRYRLFGRYDRCLLPAPEYRNRFID